MKVLLLNQCFHPDHVATAQYLTDLAQALVQAGHQVTVVASCRGYDDPAIRYPVREQWHGIDVRRIWTPGLGKQAKWRRLIDFATFWFNAARILIFMPKHDVTVEEFLGELDAHGISHAVLTAPSFYGTDNSLLLSALDAGAGRLRGTAIVAPEIAFH